MQVCIVCGLNSLIAAASWTSLDEIFHLQSVHFPSLQGNTSRSHYVGASSEVKLRSFLSILSGVCVTAVKHVTSKWREKLFAVRRSEVYFCFTSVASCKGPAGRNLLSRAGKACKNSLTCFFTPWHVSLFVDLQLFSLFFFFFPILMTGTMLKQKGSGQSHLSSLRIDQKVLVFRVCY